MFKSSANQNKLLEDLFKKFENSKNFSSLVLHKETKARLIYKDNSDNSFYTFDLSNNKWSKITDPDMLEKL